MRIITKGYSSVFNRLNIPSQEDIEVFVNENDNDLSGLDSQIYSAHSSETIVEVDGSYKSSPSPPHHIDVVELFHR